MPCLHAPTLDFSIENPARLNLQRTAAAGSGDGKFLNCEADRLRCGGEPAITCRCAPATKNFWRLGINRARVPYDGSSLGASVTV